MTGTFDKNNPLSFIDAAAKALELNGSPLHYRDITRQALDRGWIQSNGKTPEATLNAVICVDIKQKGIHSRFVRVRPGIFGLRSWGIDSAAVDSPLNTADEENRRVRIPHFLSYLELRLLLPIWNGRLRSQITGLQSTIGTLRGSPQEPGDWTKPDRWIVERLQGKDRELAEAIWQKTAEKVNPRHVYGHWLFACAYGIGVRTRSVEVLELDSDAFAQTEEGEDS